MRLKTFESFADDYKKRKQERAELYKKNHGKKMSTCTACNGSGHYDAAGSPKCLACDGKGKTRQK